MADALTIELKNEQPVELAGYTLAMLSLAKEFSRFVRDSGEPGDGEELRLYIGQIRSGSIIADLVANAHALFPQFLLSAKLLTEFAEFLKVAFESLMRKHKDDIYLDRRSLENLSQIIDPVCKDSGAQFNISTTVNNYAPVTIHMNSLEANAAQNQIRTRLEQIREPISGEHTQVAMRLFQARDDAASKSGDRAIIESISNSSVKISFADDGMKLKVLHPQAGNPFEHYYIVDVVVETVEGRPVLYKITDVHEAVYQPRLSK